MNRHFVIAGAQRSGTTYLYRMLEQHPDICMAQPMRPEPKFFLQDEAESTYDQYLSRHFTHRERGQLLGEKSTSYIEREDAILRLSRLLPQAKVVFLLRDPALRAHSNWRFSHSHGLEKLDFRAALAAEPSRSLDWDRESFSVCPFAYGARGHYSRYLDQWLACFPREQLVLMNSEVLFTNPDVVVRDLFSALELDPAVPLQSPGIVNATPVEETAMDVETLQMLRERYREDTARLSTEWGLDVSSWRG